MPYYAHSAQGKPAHEWQSLAEHLRGVARLARNCAEEAFPGDTSFAALAYAAGLLHDLGKYRPEFQDLLHGRRPKGESTRHKQAGAAFVAAQRRADVAFAIAGHHNGLPNLQLLEELIRGPGGDDVVRQVIDLAMVDCPELGQLGELRDLPRTSDPWQFDLHVRLLFSCLVDADWQDTSAYHDRQRGLPKDSPPAALEAEALLSCAKKYIASRAEKCRDASIARIRDEILQAALTAAEQPSGVFSMTVPTGGGKTLSALAFALAHAAQHGLRRVIYVAPYLSILEQNVRELRRALALGDDATTLFEHHSLADAGDNGVDENAVASIRAAELQRRAENWDSPLVVTTSVQFFESLFANQPGRCRKLHNIARSVVILDECQTLSPDLIAPTCSMLGALASTAGTSIVLCTATQPAWWRRPDLPDGLSAVREIAPAGLDLFPRLRRVTVEWPESKAEDTHWEWSQAVDTMLAERAALCVVNTKQAALAIFELLRNRAPRDAFHLSTSMCPAHRLAVIDEVKSRLQAEQPCHLVSTQLIEAGVDVDFPLVLREFAPLESIIQAAGRCNREGLLNTPEGQPGGRVIVFRAREGSLLNDWYRRGGQVLDVILGRGQPDIGRPEDIADYFQRLYATGELDRHALQAARKQRQFAEIADKYRLIDEAGLTVVVPTWKSRAEEVERRLAECDRIPTRVNFRRLAPFQVNLPISKLNDALPLIDQGRSVPIWLGEYDEQTGIALEGRGDFIC